MRMHWIRNLMTHNADGVPNKSPKKFLVFCEGGTILKLQIIFCIICSKLLLVGQNLLKFEHIWLINTIETSWQHHYFTPITQKEINIMYHPTYFSWLCEIFVPQKWGSIYHVGKMSVCLWLKYVPAKQHSLWILKLMFLKVLEHDL